MEVDAAAAPSPGPRLPLGGGQGRGRRRLRAAVTARGRDVATALPSPAEPWRRWPRRLPTPPTKTLAPCTCGSWTGTSLRRTCGTCLRPSRACGRWCLSAIAEARGATAGRAMWSWAPQPTWRQRWAWRAPRWGGCPWPSARVCRRRGQSAGGRGGPSRPSARHHRWRLRRGRQRRRMGGRAGAPRVLVRPRQPHGRRTRGLRRRRQGSHWRPCRRRGYGCCRRCLHRRVVVVLWVGLLAAVVAVAAAVTAAAGARVALGVTGRARRHPSPKRSW